ncbi:uncharacterized protein TNCT_607082 [Trichonephila clavata]|uniref:Uncharacterized protein n=1 Tax=Trichonephila clavata TaxID=2740835 RepID=A0A8X6LAT5_TRICU|nr:uncharacterized protein TNCT_607082 [Trichonephila clavata]
MQTGNQERCDNYVACKKKLPKPSYDAFKTCVQKTYPGGTLGKCNDKETLYGTPNEFHKYLQCFINTQPMKSDLSDGQKKQFDDYKKCVHNLVQDC